MKVIAWIALIPSAMVLAFIILTWVLNFHPPQVKDIPVTGANHAPSLQVGQSVKIMTYNVQYMAGKNNVFFYDLPGRDGPDERPSKEEITQTLNNVARIIRDENPDIVLLQEMDNGAKRTDYENQLQRLLPLLPEEYVCHASTFYWKSKFIPHPRIMGATGMQLVTLSKYKMSGATRHQLALVPANPIVKQYNFKRALLETRFPVQGGNDLIAINVHLEPFTEGTDVALRQIIELDSLLEERRHAGFPWIAGGDYNLLPPGHYESFQGDEKPYYRPQSEIRTLYQKYPAIPSLQATQSDSAEQWYTHFPNNPSAKGPNKTIDYIFYSGLSLVKARVRRHDALDISDHLPLIAAFNLAEDKSDKALQ